MTIITLISDYGVKDHFVAALKGTLLNAISDVYFVDISHEIPPFNLKEAAYVLLNSYLHFPKKTIHLLCHVNIVFVCNAGRVFYHRSSREVLSPAGIVCSLSVWVTSAKNRSAQR